MPIRRRHLRLAAWIALVAMWAGALMPTIAHAIAAAAGTTVEVCTVDGMRTVTIADGRAAGPVDPAAAHQGASCPYCLLGDGAAVPPRPPIETSPATIVRDRLPPLFLAAPHTLHAWVRAQPRAPPLVS